MDVNNTISIIAVAVNTFIMLFAVFSLYQSNKIHKDNHDFNRRKAATEALSAIRTRVPNLELLQTAFDHIDSNSEIDLKDITETMLRNKELKTILHSYLNYYDYISLGVRHAVFDEEIIKDARGTVMIREFRRFRAYIDDRRTISKNAWSNFESMTNKWTNEKTNKSNRRRI